MKIFDLPEQTTHSTFSTICGIFLITINVAAATAANAGDEYGDVTGRIILQGELPKLRPIVRPSKFKNQRMALCGEIDIPNDSLVIHRENRGIQNVLVYLRKTPKAGIHPKLEKSKKKTLKVSLHDCRFSPHTMVVRDDQQVVFEQGGPVGHNVHTYPIFNQGITTLVRPGKPGQPVKLQRFRLKELIPMQVKCDIHAWMQAYWLVIDHPYATTTDKDGQFTIEKLPAGEHSLTIWHERVGYIEKSFNVRVHREKQTDIGHYEVPLDRFRIKNDELVSPTTSK